MNSCGNYDPCYKFFKKDNRSVVVFSKVRIPFDAPREKGEEIKKFKEALIKAIKELRSMDTCILYARYGTTEKKRFFDVENVLFYNLGTANFHGLTNRGLVFSIVEDREIYHLQKRYAVPAEYRHYYEYSIVDKEKKQDFGSLLAKWENIPLNVCGTKPVDSWVAMKQGQNQIQVYDSIDCDKKDTFALLLNIRVSTNSPFKIMTAMKPLLDGIICAFHNSRFQEEQLEYFSKVLHCEKKFLLDERMGVLGERKGQYIRKYRNNVKWNPADDLCDYICISVTEGDSFQVSGEIYSSLQCPKCGKRKLSKLFWGIPAFDEKMENDLQSQKIKIMGCCINNWKLRYVCKWCKTMF